MPRVLRPKHHSSLFSAIGTSKQFKYRFRHKQTNFQRLLVALHATRPTCPTAVQDILEKISDQAVDNKEILGPLWAQFVHLALSVLRKSDYLECQIQDGEAYCQLTAEGIQIMTDADAWFGELWNQLSFSEKCRKVGQYIHWKISPNSIRPLTRHEMDMELLKLEQQQQEHMKVCPMLSSLEAPQICAALHNELPPDLMDVDPAAGLSTTHTPVRMLASTTYPTPRSLPRSRSSSRTASMSPPQKPLCRTTSHLAMTCRNMDWQSIVVNSKALKERSDVLQQEKEYLQQEKEGLRQEKENLQQENADLQQKIEVLEKEKEECVRQLHQANNKVEFLEDEMHSIWPRFWLLRWYSIARSGVLQRALDSAVSERESLRARLYDIERRRVAIRRIEEAENASDDHLLNVIAGSLKP